MLLDLGMNDPRIRATQYGVHILCFAVGRFDGYFDSTTAEAVRRFQQKYGVAVSGKLNDQTWNCLLNELKAIQRALVTKGSYSSAIDGIGDIELLNSIKQFQSANGLSPDGMVGAATRAKLMRSGTSEVPSSDLPLSQGSSGDKVLYLQYGLHILCCSPNGVDGVFGAGTYAAVVRFQNKYNLVADGIVGIGTWNQMCTLISVIQTALNAAGFNAGNVDGIAGPGTYAALMEYQGANNLIVDGIAGPATRTSLLGVVSDGGTDAFPLSQGSSGPYVLALQFGLFICCYNPNGVDGSFGPGTASAVRLLQSASDLSTTGVVDTATWEKLRGRIAPIQKALYNRSYDTGGIDGTPGVKTYNAVIAFQTASGLIADGMAGNATLAALGIINSSYGTTSAVLSLGASGSFTRYLQRVLAAIGYSAIPQSGTFDNATKDAVISFQTAHNLSTDGIVGPATWSAIFSNYQVNVAGNGVKKMVNVALHELSWGFQEDNGNNITPYGEWYGMNGQPWCAMFVSWCAKQAGVMEETGIADPKVPHFA